MRFPPFLPPTPSRPPFGVKKVGGGRCPCALKRVGQPLAQRCGFFWGGESAGPGVPFPQRPAVLLAGAYLLSKQRVRISKEVWPNH